MLTQGVKVEENSKRYGIEDARVFQICASFVAVKRIQKKGSKLEKEYSTSQENPSLDTSLSLVDIPLNVSGLL